MPKLRWLGSILPPINRLPKEVFVLIPRYFNGRGPRNRIPRDEPLIAMTHVCRSWRNALISTPSLWTNINFTNSRKAMEFLDRSKGQLLDVFHFPRLDQDEIKFFLFITLRNIYRLRSLQLDSHSFQLEWVLAQFAEPAPELKHLMIANDTNITGREMELQNTIFEGQFPKLTSLELHFVRTNLRDFKFPSLTRFYFRTGTFIPLRDLKLFFERCPLIESVDIGLLYSAQPPPAPPEKRVRLRALRDLELDQTACTTGLLDNLILTQRTDLLLRGRFTGEKIDHEGEFAAHIHPSSIGHLSVTREITKAVAMRNWCILSGPNGNLRFCCFEGTREDFNAEYFTSFSPISVLDIRELWVGQRGDRTWGVWEQTSDGVLGAFTVLTKVEDLIIVRCKTETFFTTLGSTTDGGILLPKLRRLKVYVGSGDLDVRALVQCAKARKGYLHPLEEVVIVLEREMGVNFVQEMESLREFVGELSCRIGEAPKLSYDMEGIPGYNVRLG